MYVRLNNFSLQSNNSGDTVMLWETIFCSFWAFNFVFVSCELGQRYSNKFNEIGKVFGKIDWYLLPIEIQRILPIIMIYLQEQNEFKFFGECSCSRKQFQKVSFKKQFKFIAKIYISLKYGNSALTYQKKSPEILD